MAATRLAAIAKASEPGPGVTRLPYTKEHRAALDLLATWMQEAGLTVHLDAAGTLVGRLEGPKGAPTFLMGSHQDSVREGGAYDGIMGIVLPVLALQRLHEASVLLPFNVEVLVFADEEGVRFPSALIGPRALAGSFDPTVLEMTDADGTSMWKAMQAFGLSPHAVANLQREGREVLGYLETHIEQGPVLEKATEALGVVTAICGIERHTVLLTGETGHAGTVPMAMRRDALVGAAAIVSRVHQLANDNADLLGTVGYLSVAPNAVNAIPREVRLSVELRSPDDSVREAAGQELHAFAHQIARDHDLSCDISRSYMQPAQPCDRQLIQNLKEAVQKQGGLGLTLPSGATHDASAMADLCPVAMLFVRCRGGVSHSPKEYADPGDMAIAVDTICEFLEAKIGSCFQ